MKFQRTITLLFFISQFTFGYAYAYIYAEDAVANPLPQNGIALMIANRDDARTRTSTATRVYREDVIKGYERLMTEARRIPLAAQSTYLVAIENHPKVVEARADIAKNGSFWNHSGVLIQNRHNFTIAGLQLAQLAIANNTAEIDRQIENSARYQNVLAQLNTAYYLVRTMLP